MQIMKMITALLAVVLTVSMLLVGITSSAPYDPWIDLDDDGDIDIFDIVKMAGAYGTTGTPINKTALLLELAARIDTLNATVRALVENQVLQVYADVEEMWTTGTGTATVSFPFNFTSPPTISATGTILSGVNRGKTLYIAGITTFVDHANIDLQYYDAGSWTNLGSGVRVQISYTAVENRTASMVARQVYLTIAPTAFTPELPQLQAFWKTRYVVGGSGSCFACVELPDGVQITNVTARLEDFHNDAQVSIGLHRVNVTGPSEVSDSLATIYSGTAAQPGDAILYDDTIDYAQIDNKHFYYVVELYLNYEASDLNLHWLQLNYEY